MGRAVRNLQPCCVWPYAHARIGSTCGSSGKWTNERTLCKLNEYTYLIASSACRPACGLSGRRCGTAGTCRCWTGSCPRYAPPRTCCRTVSCSRRPWCSGTSTSPSARCWTRCSGWPRPCTRASLGREGTGGFFFVISSHALYRL
jgi:hypothetical protein